MTEAIVRTYFLTEIGYASSSSYDFSQLEGKKPLEVAYVNQEQLGTGRETWLKSLNPSRRFSHVHHDPAGAAMFEDQEIKPGSTQMFIIGEIAVVISHMPVRATELPAK